MGEIRGDVGKGEGREMWGIKSVLGPHTSTHFPTSPLTSPTPHHTLLHLLSYLFPHPSFFPPHPNTFSYYPHISLHLLKVWRSYHVMKLPCGEVTVAKLLWQSYHVAKILATEQTKFSKELVTLFTSTFLKKHKGHFKFISKLNCLMGLKRFFQE